MHNWATLVRAVSSQQQKLPWVSGFACFPCLCLRSLQVLQDQSGRRPMNVTQNGLKRLCYVLFLQRAGGFLRKVAVKYGVT